MYLFLCVLTYIRCEHHNGSRALMKCRHGLWSGTLAPCWYMYMHSASLTRSSLINTVVVYAYWTVQVGRDVYVRCYVCA